MGEGGGGGWERKDLPQRMVVSKGQWWLLVLEKRSMKNYVCGR